MKKKVILVIIVVGVAALAAAFAWSGGRHPYERVSYPYVCKECRAVFDVSELKKDGPRTWRIPKGAPSDSVVICVRCNKGWAYPVGKCDDCGTEHILHLVNDSRCPKCFPEAAKAAQKAGVDVVFKRP